MGSNTATLPEGTHVNRRKNAAGEVIHYYYHRATKTRLPDPAVVGMVAFRAAFDAAAAAGQAAPQARRATTDLNAAFRLLCSTLWWQGLAPSTRRDHAALITLIEGDMGHFGVSEIETHHVYALRNDLAETPRKSERAVMLVRRAIEQARQMGWCSINPAVGVERLAYERQPAQAWTPQAFDCLCESFPPHLSAAIRLARLTGASKVDVVGLRLRDALVERRLVFGRAKTGEQVAIDWSDAPGGWPEMTALLEDLGAPDLCGAEETILRTSRGTPWTSDGLAASFQTARNRLADELVAGGEAALGGEVRACCLHGLRVMRVEELYAHVAAGRMAEDDVAALVGHSKTTMTRHYGRRVFRAARGKSAMNRALAAGVEDAGVKRPCKKAVKTTTA